MAEMTSAQEYLTPVHKSIVCVDNLCFQKAETTSRGGYDDERIKGTVSWRISHL